MKIFLLIFLAIIFIPFPIIFQIDYLNNNLHIKLFGLISLNTSKSKIKETKEKHSKSTNKSIKLFSNYFSPKSLLSTLSKNKFKPIFKIKGSVDYSLNDSAHTAIAYGIFSSFFPFLYKLLSHFFILKDFSVQIHPIFKDKFLINLKIKCIFFISLVQIIYMMFLLLINMAINKIKAVNTLSG